MKLNSDMHIDTTVRLKVGSKIYILPSVMGIDKSLKGRTAVIHHEGNLYLGRITQVDENDTEYTYRVKYLAECDLDEDQVWHEPRNVLVLGENELDGIKVENPEMFV